MLPRFPPRHPVGRSLSEVPLVRRRAVEGRVRPVVVVPGDVAGKFLFERVPPEQHEDAAKTFLFHRPDEPLDDCDAAVAADGPFRRS